MYGTAEGRKEGGEREGKEESEEEGGKERGRPGTTGKTALEATHHFRSFEIYLLQPGAVLGGLKALAEFIHFFFKQ